MEYALTHVHAHTQRPLPAHIPHCAFFIINVGWEVRAWLLQATLPKNQLLISVANQRERSLKLPQTDRPIPPHSKQQAITG